MAAADGDGACVISIADQSLPAKVANTGGWDQFLDIAPGTIEVKQAGELTVSVRAKDGPSWKAINLNSLRLEPANDDRP